jgi:two-component system chemotaxis response regulator CheB
MVNDTTAKVLIVDDSALIRGLLKNIFDSDSRLTVVGSAEDPYVARELIKKLNPDVVTLDIEMPRMNGISFLKNLMRLRPMPVVMISTLTQTGAPMTLEALELGAVDFVGKPSGDAVDGLGAYRDEICDKVYSASRANVRRMSPVVSQTKGLKKLTNSASVRPDYICAIGASTGGTEAIAEVISALPVDCPATVISQHIPAAFSASFAKRLNGMCVCEVVEAEQNLEIKQGRIIIAQGDSHLRVRKRGTQYYCDLGSDEPVNRHRPSVDVMFESVATVAGKNVCGVILTGMGADGAQGLLKIREAGATTLGQDEATCVVYGMPRSAMQVGAVQHQMALENVAAAILKDYAR